MLDIKFIRDNLELIKENIAKRYVKANVDLAIELYDKKNNIQVQLDSLRQARNENANKMKAKLEQDERNKLIEEGKELKSQISLLEQEILNVNNQFLEEVVKIPNLTHPSTPIGTRLINNANKNFPLSSIT